jgi:hypothetical protein
VEEKPEKEAASAADRLKELLPARASALALPSREKPEKGPGGGKAGPDSEGTARATEPVASR